MDRASGRPLSFSPPFVEGCPGLCAWEWRQRVLDRGVLAQFFSSWSSGFPSRRRLFTASSSPPPASTFFRSWHSPPRMGRTWDTSATVSSGTCQGLDQHFTPDAPCVLRDCTASCCVTESQSSPLADAIRLARGPQSFARTPVSFWWALVGIRSREANAPDTVLILGERLRIEILPPRNGISGIAPNFISGFRPSRTF